jgi:hypothetical protein
MTAKFKIRKRPDVGWDLSKEGVVEMALPTWADAIRVACKLASWGY